MQGKEIVGLLLAGGQGSRLGVLTSSTAKPSVAFGGKYSIIDFPLSNCANSGIDTVGVFTQYEPLELNAHMGIGKPWGMDRLNGGLTILQPYLRNENNDWFTGTANAVYQNIDYIDGLNPKYVLILSGDHIYKMDYSKMLIEHKDNNADGTISVINVSMEEASRFGIMNTDENNKIYEFEEKPEHPKSTLASMGVYIFTWDVLRKYLIEDEANKNSDKDFGKNIIPKMLEDGRRMFAYVFEGYWKDVGTIDSYWQANMDLIERVPTFNLFDPNWKVYSPNPVMPAHYIGPNGSAKRSIIAEGCKVYGTIRNSILFPGVTVGEGALVEDSVLMQGVVISEGSYVNKAIIANDSEIGKNVKIGVGDNTSNKVRPDLYHTGICVFARNVKVPDNTEIGKNVVIHKNVTHDDFHAKVISSGETVFKGGASDV